MKCNYVQINPDDFWYLVGVFLGDGYCRPGSNYIEICCDNLEWAEYIQKLVNTPNVIRFHGGGYYVSFAHKELAANKFTIPTESKDKINYLVGLFDAEGCVHPQSISFNMKNQDIVGFVYKTLQDNYIKSNNLDQ